MRAFRGIPGLSFLLCACSFPAAPFLAPPPFGPDSARPEKARLFFPTGLAIEPTTRFIVVANSNADHQYDAGAMYALPPGPVLQYFQPEMGPGQAGEERQVEFPASALTGTAMIGNYSGPLLLSGTTAYTGSRDSNRLNAVVLDMGTGALSCRSGAGPEPGNQDCRGGVIDLAIAAGLEGPYALAKGPVRPVGSAQDVDAILVSALIPHIDEVLNGVAYTSSRIAALDSANPGTLLFRATVTDRVVGAGIGAGPMVYDERRREVILGGCYARFPNVTQGGTPSSGKCIPGQVTNLLRFISVDAGSAAQPRLYDMGPQLHATETDGLALGDVDPASGSRTLYATTRNPDLLAQIQIPGDPATAPIVRRATPLPAFPGQILRILRPPGATGPELLAIAGGGTYGTLVVFNASTAQVLGQVERLGDTPFAIAQVPPRAGDLSAKLLITVFGDCRLALVDVPYGRPAEPHLRARIGSCPP